MMIPQEVTVDYYEYKITVNVTHYLRQSPDRYSDSDMDYHGYSEIDYDIISVYGMSYDEYGEEMGMVSVERCLEEQTEREFITYLFNNYGIDLCVYYGELSDHVEVAFRDDWL